MTRRGRGRPAAERGFRIPIKAGRRGVADAARNAGARRLTKARTLSRPSTRCASMGCEAPAIRHKGWRFAATDRGADRSVRQRAKLLAWSSSRPGATTRFAKPESLTSSADRMSPDRPRSAGNLST